MARELKDYRDNMELLNIRYPDHEMLTIAEVNQVFGWKSEATARRHLPIAIGKVSKVAVAKLMCGGCAR